MGLNAAIAAGIRDKEHFIAAPEALDHVERGTGARPEAGDDEAIANRCFDRLHKIGSEPGVDGRAIDDLVTRKNLFGDLWNEWTREGLRRDRRKNRRYIKKLRALGDDLKVVLDRVAIVALDTHEHLRLKIDQQQRRIVG
jgi:hypothetical protein